MCWRRAPRALPARDAALARAIATVTFRHLGTIRRALAERLSKGLADERLFALLATGAAQLLFLDVPDHAAVDLSVRLARGERRLQHAAGLVNAVLRRMARERAAILAAADPLAARYARLARGALDGGLRTRTGPRDRRRRTPPRRRSTSR